MNQAWWGERLPPVEGPAQADMNQDLAALWGARLPPVEGPAQAPAHMNQDLAATWGARLPPVDSAWRAQARHRQTCGCGRIMLAPGMQTQPRAGASTRAPGAGGSAANFHRRRWMNERKLSKEGTPLARGFKGSAGEDLLVLCTNVRKACVRQMRTEWDPQEVDELLDSEGGVLAGMGSIHEYRHCLQYFARRAEEAATRQNRAPSHVGPVTDETELVVLRYEAMRQVVGL